ncbi:unnamed protein product [Caenorhabditis angaria]|uniref:Uncharacterized protein n=1 Tax=Caenorhabditis angaria TaxID=860376 RepID=A0A9P1IV40_9PELO|nr:unnamed protein product [Caenorhabditis angaria]
MKTHFFATNVVGEEPFLMIDLANMHQIKISTPQSTYPTFLLILICFLIFLVIFATCVMVVSFFRRKMAKNREFLISRSATSETLIIESTLTNYNSIDV